MTPPEVALYSTTCHVDPNHRKKSDIAENCTHTTFLTVGSDMVFHGCISVCNGDGFERLVPGQGGRVEENLEVHHIINNDLEIWIRNSGAKGFRMTYLEANIRVFPPTPGGTNDGAVSRCKEFRERVYRCFSSLVIWVTIKKSALNRDTLICIPLTRPTLQRMESSRTRRHAPRHLIFLEGPNHYWPLFPTQANRQCPNHSPTSHRKATSSY